MHISPFQLLTALGALVVLALLIWLVVIRLRPEHYTRERFAFVALSGFLGTVGTVLLSMQDKQTPLGEILDFVRQMRGYPTTAEPARTTDHLLMLLVLVLVGIVILRFYDNWNGAISTKQYMKERYHEPSSIIVEGVVEAKRIIKREPPLEVYKPGPNHRLTTALDPPEANLAWYAEAVEFICLRNPAYIFDRDAGWHQGIRCWVGTNRNTSQLVAIRCEEADLSDVEIVQFVDYVERLRQSARLPGHTMELIIAVRNSLKTDPMIVRGHTVGRETRRTLLEGLVDFSDYFADISSRVKIDPLPDSAMTLDQVYTPASCRGEDGKVHTDLEAYIRSWIDEPGQRQLALLGEYGQGKSTTALMTTYHLIQKRKRESRIPILIELRGRSPQNMTPEDILAAWAYPYRIDPKAVMRLLVAGQLLIIFEGFDEMALVGDSEARLSHFRTLWKFCYPPAKILITGRPNFFLDDNEMRAALGVSRSVAAGPYCEALHLEPFSLSQIGSALRAVSAKDRNEIVELAKNDAKFREIISRGSLLYVVSQLWGREKLSQYAGSITSAFVMNLFIQHSYRRQSMKEEKKPNFMILTEGERKYFMSGIAAYMGAMDLSNQITRGAFEKAVRELYAVIPDSVSYQDGGLPKLREKPLKKRLQDAEDAVEDVCNDVRSSGILVLDQTKSGALRFAHKFYKMQSQEKTPRRRPEFFLLRSPLDRARSVLSDRAMCSVVGHGSPVVWIFSTSGFHRFFTTKPVRSETSKAEPRSIWRP